MDKAVLTHLRDDCLAMGIHIYSPSTGGQFHPVGFICGFYLKGSDGEAGWVKLTNLPQCIAEGPRDSGIIA